MEENDFSDDNFDSFLVSTNGFQLFNRKPKCINSINNWTLLMLFLHYSIHRRMEFHDNDATVSCILLLCIGSPEFD